jgi:protein involved in polysaccharide export with SLBB domain
VKASQAKLSLGKNGRWVANLLALVILIMGACALSGAAQAQVTPPSIFNPPVPQQQEQQDTQPPSASTSDSPQQIPNMNQDTQGRTQRSLEDFDRTQNQNSANRLQAKPDKPTEFQQMVRVTTGRSLPIFGASIFSSRLPSTFAPVQNIPVTPDYVIGPGDELRIDTWGQVNQRGLFTVDRTGAISIPQVGAVHVAGLRFDQVTEFLRGQLGRVYRNFDINVNMGQLRSIQVFVVGQARRPGSYTISSLSTLLNAVFASGGPLPQGSVRDIQLKRNGKTVVDFDLYDMLLRGDKSKDVPLAPGDVVFIPPVGPQVAVVGSINVPAVYELHGETTIEQLLELAGGRTNTALGSKVRVERIYEHEMHSLVEVDLSKSGNMPLQNGDVVFIDAIVDQFKNAVTLRGNVANPGRYAWHPGMKISDLIPDKEMLITRDYWQKRSDLGQMPVLYKREQERDAEGNPIVRRYGNGRYPITGYFSQGDLSRTGSQQQQLEGAQDQSSNLNNNIQGQQDQSDYENNSQAQPNDFQNTLPGGVGQTSTSQQRQNNSPNDRRDTATTNTTTGGSSVGSALTGGSGQFPVKTKVTMAAPDINWSYAVIERQSKNDLKTSLLSFNLGKVILGGDQLQNLELLPNDVVTVFSTADLRVPTAEQTRFVTLEGEFVGSGVYSVLPGETLRQLLKRAGGFTPDAYLYASEFTRQSTKRVEQQRLKEYADQLDAQSAVDYSANNARSLSDRDAAAAAAATTQAQAVVARLRRAQPSGRIVLQLKPNSSGVDSLPDLALEDGDRFVVPRVPSNVNVEGQVYSASAFVYESDKQTRFYLREAGGPDRLADKSREFVLRADGSVLSRQYGNFDKAIIYPGDTIVIPQRLQARAILRNMVDIATIVGQFGLGLAAINVLK